MRFFLAHPKTDDDHGLAVLEHAVRDALCALDANPSAPAFTLTTGLDDYNRHFRECGGWNQWIERWAVGVDPYGAPHYTGIICTHGVCARANGEGVKMALAAHKPVYLFHLTGGDLQGAARGVFLPVNGIERLNREYREDGKVERFGHFRLQVRPVLVDTSQATM